MQKLSLSLLVCSLAVAYGQPVPQSLFDRLEWRNIGPFRGGRVAAVSGVAGDPATFYFGSVGGGVWKTTSAGTVWNPIFDQQKIASIGALAVAPSDPNIVYVGTGETDIRAQIGFGDGVYKSTDAGKTWTNMGLRETRQIARILVDPHDPNRVFVAALGHVYGPNPERGVFRSTDGGQTWEKVLFTTPEVGAVDVAWDPAKPQVLFASMWNGHRPPWSQYPAIDGPGSGLWKSIDGGDHWSQLTGHGLPLSMWRRSGVAAGREGRVYAIVDSAVGAGLYRSNDGGENWFLTTSDARLTGRGWYFCSVTVDPKNPDLVYVPNVSLYRSTNGGVTFQVLKGAPGGDDYHVVWIDPSESRRMILGSDQGTNISVDQGATWSTWMNQPTAQIYHVTTDNRFPYAVYGAQQDSGTAAVMSRTDHWTIDARDWFSVGGAEAGNIAVDPRNSTILYVGDAFGSLVRFDRRTSEAQNITPWPVRGDFGAVATQKYRYPWTAPLAFSAAEPGALYFGAQVLFKTLDGGLTWKEISPDLTGDQRKDYKMVAEHITPENAREQGFGVIYAVAPSPLRAGVIWAGSDTGLLHVTQNGGQSWQNVTPEGLPNWSRVTCIEASHFDPATAYATVDRHRMEDYRPYVYRTRDYGKSWKLVVDGLAEPAYVNGIREDPAHKGLLYGATELGVVVSFDDAAHWQPLQLNLPAVSVRDLVVHGDDLVIATHGRGFWILDDMTPLRQVDTKAEVLLYKPATAIRTNPQDFMGTPVPVEEPQAKNPPAGAILDYYFRSAPKDVKLEIFNAAGTSVRRFVPTPPPAPRAPGAIADVWLTDPPAVTTRAGMNRFVWDLRYAAPEQVEESESGRPAPGPLVLPGAYQVKLTVDGKTYSQSLVVKQDPRSSATPLELSKQHELSLQCVKALAKAAELTRTVEAQQKAAKTGEQIADAARASEALKRITPQLLAALAVAQSADRTPPAVAYSLCQTAEKALAEVK